MNNKIKLLAFALFLLGGFALQAQPGGGGRSMNPEQRAERQTAQMTEKLALSDAQAGKVKDINLKYANKMKEARDKADGDWSNMRETMGAIRDEQDKELQTVLTGDQWKKWSEYQEEFRNNRGNQRPNADGQGQDKKPKKGKKGKKADSDPDSDNK